MALLKIAQYPQNADGTPMDLEVGVLTGPSGNGGARLANVPIGPDNAPIDAKGLVLVDSAGNFINVIGAVAADRTALSIAPKSGIIFLTESGREGTFAWDSSNLSAKVTADTAQGIYVAPASDVTGASGAWVRKFSGPALSTWWGVSATATDAANTAAYNAALATLQALKVTGLGYGHGGSIGLHTPAGTYNFNAELALKHAVAVTGDYHGQGSDGTNFHWTVSNCHGFHIVKSNGTDDGYGATIRGFNLSTTYTNGPEGAYHAIFQNAKANIVDVFASNWAGDCVYGLGDTGTDGSNLNGSHYQNIFAQNVGWTVHIQGGDANASCAYNIQGYLNRRGTIFDQSFLGNAWFGGFAETVGLATNFPTRCVYGATHVYVVAYGQEGWCSTNAPTGTATSNQGWLYLQEGAASATQPAWVTGQTWYWSAPFASTPGSATNSARIEGVYAEGNGNPPVLSDAGTISIVDDSSIPYVWTSTGALHGGRIKVSGGTTMVLPNNLNVGGNIIGVGLTNDFGPQSVVADHTVNLNSGNVNNFLNFKSWSAGVSQIDGFIQSIRGTGLQINATGGIIHEIAGSGVVQTLSTGLWLWAGKTITNQSGALTINGVGGVPLQYNGVTQLTVGNGTINVPTGTVYQVNGTQVVTARQTGWTADTGTAKKTANASYTAGATLTYSAAYVQAEQTAMATRMAAVEAALQNISQTQKALKDALIAHGLIGA